MTVAAHGPVLTTHKISEGRVTVAYPQFTERDLFAPISTGARWPGPEGPVLLTCWRPEIPDVFLNDSPSPHTANVTICGWKEQRQTHNNNAARRTSITSARVLKWKPGCIVPVRPNVTMDFESGIQGGNSMPGVLKPE